MHITSFGCSLTFGTDLADVPADSCAASPSQLTWPALVSRELGLPYRCFAKGGSGNLCVLDRVLSMADFTQQDLFIVNWTFMDRFDYTDPMACHAGDGIIEYQTLLPGHEDYRSKFYYQHMHSSYRDKLTNLMSMQLVLQTLFHHRARFVMTAIDDLLWDTDYHAPKIIQDLQRMVRPWIQQFDHCNFLTWCRRNGFDTSHNNHPKEAAHVAAAKLMLPVIDAILHRA